MKNRMFTGWKDVFSFTFEQNVKTKSFKTALIGIGILMFIIFFAVNMGVGYYKDSKKPEKQMGNDINELYVFNDTGINEIEFAAFSEYSEFEKNMTITVLKQEADIKKQIEEANKNEKNVMSIKITKNAENENGTVEYEFLVDQSSTCKDKTVRKIANEFMEFFDECKLVSVGISGEQMSVIMSDSSVNTMDIKDADKSISEILIEIFLPMIVVLIMYMLVLMHGQSISKIIVIEKNSKLMETLLISVKPYAVILGKVLAMYVVAIIEMAAWVISGVAGYLISDKIAGSMFNKYENPVNAVIKMMQKGSEQAFSAQSVILCVLAVLIGFLAYCVLSGLITSNITKAEDLANGTAVYQMIVVIGFLAAYMLPLLRSDSPLIGILRYVPITSVFMLPSDILIGSISAVGAVISISILVITTVVMVVLTGKIYKKKVF